VLTEGIYKQLSGLLDQAILFRRESNDFHFASSRDGHISNKAVSFLAG
jgi:hypothetical protein